MPAKENGSFPADRAVRPVATTLATYGQWESSKGDPTKVSPEALEWILRSGIHHGGIYEVSCDPGYFDPAASNVNHEERGWERETLCDPRSREVLVEEALRLSTMTSSGRRSNG